MDNDRSSGIVPSRRNFASRRAALLASAFLVAGGILAAGGSSLAGTLRHQPRRASVPAPGTWTALGLGYGGTPAVLLGPGNDATIIWLAKIDKVNYTYEEDILGADGAIVVAPGSIFGPKGWGGLFGDPVLVPHGNLPLVIFSGSRSSSSKDPYSPSCVYGAAGQKTVTDTWTLEPWSLSNDCYNPLPGATETKRGTLSADWGGSCSGKTALRYRIGTSPTIPATGNDGCVYTAGGGDNFGSGEAADTAGNDDVYVVWRQGFSKPSGDDGYYVKDVTAGGKLLKAPGSGSNSVNNVYSAADDAITNTNTHAGIYVAYCSNGSTCSLVLWHVGAAKAIPIPDSSPSSDVAISAGPDGRLWLAWYNHTTNDVSIVRTNRADTAFGAITTYKTPCFEDGLPALSGGSFDRVDVVLSCVNEATKIETYVTQAFAGLSLRQSKATIHNNVTNDVTFEVNDAGDPVAGATVTVDGKTAKTPANGKVTIAFAKGAKTGVYAVTASMTDYFSAHGSLSIKS